jgi:hypothetical protein
LPIADRATRRNKEEERAEMKYLVCALAIVFVLTATVSAQEGRTFELAAGYAHITGNQGLDGLNVGAAYWFTSRISLALDYDTAWDTTRLGVFEFTTAGLTTTSSHLQNFLVGPRIGMPGLLHMEKLKGHALLPYLEAQFGGSHLSSDVTAQNFGHVSGSDTAFTWMIGGGADFKLSEDAKWFARAKLDFERTHFVSQGQSRLRFGIGIAHTFHSRP